MDDNSLDSEFVQEQIEKANKIINNLEGQHNIYSTFFDIENEKLDSFTNSLYNALLWLRQASIDYSEYCETKDD